MVENQIPRREGHSIFYLHPPPLPLKMIGTKPLKFCLILEMLPVPFEKMKSEGFIFSQHF